VVVQLLALPEVVAVLKVRVLTAVGLVAVAVASVTVAAEEAPMMVLEMVVVVAATVVVSVSGIPLVMVLATTAMLAVVVVAAAVVVVVPPMTMVSTQTVVVGVVVVIVVVGVTTAACVATGAVPKVVESADTSMTKVMHHVMTGQTMVQRGFTLTGLKRRSLTVLGSWSGAKCAVPPPPLLNSPHGNQAPLSTNHSHQRC
jgi:hypothetical protein